MTLYLSRLMLDPLARRVQKELAQPYEMHRTLCHAFPNLSPEEWEAARVLFRADEDNRVLSLLVQSKRPPDWSAFAARLEGQRYLLASAQTKAWQPRFERGQRLRFRLQANPVYTPKENGTKNGMRRGLMREAERLDWLRRQSEAHGFDLPVAATTLRRSGEKRIVFRGQRQEEELLVDLPLCEVTDLNDGKRFGIPATSNQFSAARFDGQLQVSDSLKFIRAIENGIGKARGFGFGLLSVAPATS